MNCAIDNLMNEHQLILSVLASLNNVVNELNRGKTISRETVADFARFFRDFADKCHHCKEEDRLFATMNHFGFQREYGPVAVMLAEHTEGRSHVRELFEIGQGTGPLNKDEIQRVIDHGGEFVPLLTAHIAKEDNILYPMAQNFIPPSELAKLDTDCETFERQVMAPGEVEELRAMAQRLTETHPGDRSQLAALSKCFSCH